MVPLTNSTLVAPAFSALARARCEHLVGHVHPVRLAGRADPAGGQQDVDAAAGAQVEHGLALVQVGDGERVAAAQARGDRLGGQRVTIGTA